jgi:predicted nuclease with TOPRIM domain
MIENQGAMNQTLTEIRNAIEQNGDLVRPELNNIILNQENILGRQEQIEGSQEQIKQCQDEMKRKKRKMNKEVDNIKGDIAGIKRKHDEIDVKVKQITVRPEYRNVTMYGYSTLIYYHWILGYLGLEH